jgi:hypothetical protein
MFLLLKGFSPALLSLEKVTVGACRFVLRSNNCRANIILINTIGDYDFRLMTEHFVRFLIRR